MNLSSLVIPVLLAGVRSGAWGGGWMCTVP